MTRTSRSLLRRASAAVAAATLVAVLAACSPSGTSPGGTRLTPSASPAASGIVYWSDGATSLRLTACLPQGASASTTPVPAMVLLHGGGFSEGSRSSGGTPTICALLASNGVAAFAIDYRLVPDAKYPKQVDDLQHAITWLREAAQVQRFGIDPARIGVFGSSAGAIIAQEEATAGSGALTSGTRVKAVVSLSGVSDMTASGEKLGSPSADMQQLVLRYLGCTSVAAGACGDAQSASPIKHVDPTDPPMLLVNGSEEIVPKEQATAMRSALQRAKVPVSLVVVPGSGHGVELLNSDVRNAIKKFLAERL